ncbi:MAG: GntR family transcriptional regulator [Gordonia sp. (in: high G+C Gram-positive bacteria)]|uniref:GntR family transcriptional regulator n=1 Tax=Gordonia TaxID=2053 RepID=UPI003266282F
MALSRHRQLPDAVAGHVREQIMAGNLRPGEFLRMEPIAEAVGVSITPVREGLLRLSSEGFVHAVPRRGFVVAEFTRQDIRDLFWVQSQLAGELAARAAVRRTDDALAELHELMLQCEQAIAGSDTDALTGVGRLFHRRINLSAASDHLARLYASIVNHLPDSFYSSIEARVRTVAPDHRELYAAIEARDAELAREIGTRHIAGNADFVIALLEERGIWLDHPA